MSLRYLIGPVSAAWADEYLHCHILAGNCKTFDAESGIKDNNWNALVASQSTDWVPDVFFVFLRNGLVPPKAWLAPVPHVALAFDWKSHWHAYRRNARYCDLVLANAAGVEAFHREGILFSQAVNLFGFGRSWADLVWPAEKRDVDVLFVGNSRLATQREWYSLLIQLATLRPRWRVLFVTDVVGDDYRRLLARSRIVFNQNTDSEWHQLVAEAVAAGAPFFHEANSSDDSQILRDRQDYVRFDRGNVEELLVHFLEHENERKQITENAHLRLQEFSFSHQWESLLTSIETQLPILRERASSRQEVVPDFITRSWVHLSNGIGSDPTLKQDLLQALQQQPRNAHLHNALGVLAARVEVPAEMHAACVHAANAFQNAWRSDPCHIVAGLNFTEVLVRMGQSQHAIEQAGRTLEMLDEIGSMDLAILNAPHVLTDLDEFRVEWERAAWNNAGHPEQEAKAKATLVRWRLHHLLAELQDDAVHGFTASSLRPDSPRSMALLGRLLTHKGREREAIPYLRHVAEANPFDARASRTLYDVLGKVGLAAQQQRLAVQWRRLSETVPSLVPAEEWFAERSFTTAASMESTGSPARIAWHGSQEAMHSLALVNREICLRLARHGHELSLLPARCQDPPGARVQLPVHLQSSSNKPLSKLADVHISHQYPPDFTAPSEGHWVIIQPWEFGSIPRAWIEPMTRLVDEIWVPSHFVRECFVHSGIPAERVHVVPNGVSDVFLRDGPSPFALQTTKRYKFLFVGGTIERKGIDLLLKAYSQTFCDRDDVCLVIKDMGVGTFYQGQTAEQLIGQFRQAPQAPAIEYLNRELSDEEMAGLYAACDCLVHPYRGEGFGLPIAEAMACGLPVIVTGYGAALDFCREEHTYLIPARIEHFREKRVGDFETVDRPWWAEPDIDQLRYRLRFVMEHAEDAKGKGKLAQEFIRTYFTWDRSVAVLEQRLQAIRAHPIRRPFQSQEPTSVRVPLPQGNFARGKVSLTMIVKNEEANLAACLQSVADLVNEIVIVDTGSTDATKAIAQRFGAKIADFPWVDSFSAARNESLRHATSEWIFWMDADDRLDEENRRKLRELFAQLPNENIGFVMKCLCLPDSDTGTATVVDHIRLFRNQPQIRWKYRIHEQILPAIRRQAGRVQWSEIVIHHVGYQNSGVRKGKLERDRRLLMMEYQEQPDDPFTLFNLGSIYQEQGKASDALNVFRRSLEHSAPEDSIVRKLYAMIVQSHRQLKQTKEALAACDEGRRHYPDDLEILFQEALVRREAGDRPGAIASLERILSHPEGNHFASVDTGLRGYKTRHNLAVYLEEEGRHDDAETQWQLAIAEQPTFIPALAGLAEIRLKANDWPGFEEFVARLHTTNKGDLEALTLSGRKHLAQGEYSMARQTVQQAIGLNPQAVWPRVLLTHVLLQEGKDWPAAEEALRAVLTLDPNHAEAHRNLELLQIQQQQKRL